MCDTGEIRDYTKARIWYLKAAEKGHKLSQTKLGDLYVKGLGVDADPAKALFWYTLAGKKAAKKRNALRGKMTAKQQRDAVEQLKEWRAKQK